MAAHLGSGLLTPHAAVGNVHAAPTCLADYQLPELEIESPRRIDVAQPVLGAFGGEAPAPARLVERSDRARGWRSADREPLEPPAPDFGKSRLVAAAERGAERHSQPADGAGLAPDREVYAIPNRHYPLRAGANRHLPRVLRSGVVITATAGQNAKYTQYDELMRDSSHEQGPHRTNHSRCGKGSRSPAWL